MAQKENALARLYKTKFIGSRKIWSAKFQVDVKEEGGRGSDLNVQWTLSGQLLNMSTVPNNNKGLLKTCCGTKFWPRL